MKLICKINNLNDITNPEISDYLKKYISLSDGHLYLEIGKEYTAYGLTFWEGRPWYYVCREDYDTYPVPMCAEFFTITQNRLSPDWRMVYDGAQSYLVFDEWAEDLSFYERLVDDEPTAVATFLKYKTAMDYE